MPTGASVLVLAFTDVARKLGVTEARVAAMVDAGDLAALTAGDWGARFVPRTEVERLLLSERV